MTSGEAQPSVEDINRALRLLRRMLARIALIFVGGLILDVILFQFSGALGEFGLIALLVALIAEVWIDGRAIGHAIGDSTLKAMPLLAMLSAPQAIAQRADAAGMEWTGFFGPLRPKRRR